MAILSFFFFMALVSLGTLAFGYGLSLLGERTESRRCRMPHGIHRRRTVRRQRVRCRYEG